jgi:membrane-bound lytic murein transglycosylase A
MSARTLTFSDLPGWAEDDHAAALAVLLRHCRPGREAEIGDAGQPHPDALCAAAARAALPGPEAAREAARRFFETWFVPRRVAEPAFLTAYYEPEFDGALARDARHQVPLLTRPPELVALDDTTRPADFPQGFPFAFRGADGTLSLPPERGAIMDGALAGRGLELVWLADPVDAFYVHVQGSARIRLAGGGTMRVGYAGKTGHPYSPIGRVMIERGLAEPGTVTMQVLRSWLAENPGEIDQVLRRNRSYIFFREIEAGEDDGPTGAAGLPLVAGRSLAIDATRHRYGTPVFVGANLPTGPDGALEPFRRLMIAEDTGSAIVGEARGDLFLGSGREAGETAGRIQHTGSFVVLEPREAAP